MPTQGLSLVGFLDQQEAVNLLRNSCVVADGSDPALAVEWQAAKAKLGAPAVNAGQPDLQPIPAAGHGHMAQLTQQPWILSALQGTLVGATFQMVELAPLLAYQFNVDMARSDHHNGGATAPAPPLDKVLEMCLPLNPIIENVRSNPLPNAVLITSKGLNFQPLSQGVMQTPAGHFVGLQVGLSLPLMHVTRLNGRCYLHNGYHRAVGLARRGVTHAPCIFRDVPDHATVGLRKDLTFDAQIMESANPPTVAHLAEGRAYDVTLKVFTRTLHVSWADHVTTED